MWSFSSNTEAIDTVNRVVPQLFGDGYLVMTSEETGDLSFQGPKGQQIPFDWLSSGEQRILTMLGLIATRRPDIVLIDDIEDHLSLLLQQLIISFIRDIARETQIICTAHSDEVLQSVPSEERFHLTR